MSATVTLAVVRGKLQGQQFAFAERATCILGRAADCQPRLPDDPAHRRISRHHCLLDINPPDIRVRDFGSMNGTFVNAELIGQRPRGMTPEQGAQLRFLERDLKDGDLVKLGDTEMQVKIVVPACCATCSVAIPELQKAASQKGPGYYLCERCARKAEVASPTEGAAPPSRVCARCGHMTRQDDIWFQCFCPNCLRLYHEK